MSAPAKESVVRVWFADVAYAVRALISNPRYSVPAVVSLVLGIAASTAVFAIYSAIALRPLPFPQAGQLVRVRLGDTAGGDPSSAISFTYYSELKELHTVFSSLGAYNTAGVTITGMGNAQYAQAARVTPDFFGTLKPGAERGRTFTANDPSTVAVVSHSFALSTFGEAPSVGKTILVNGQPKTIVGVLPDERALPAEADVWYPIQLTEEEKTERFRLVLIAVGRLAAGMTVKSARERLHAVGIEQNMRVPDGAVVYGTVQSLRQSLVGNRRTGALLMLVAVFAFLLLACSNVASLMVTRASLRSRELAIRAAVGAGPMTLARQSGLESILLTLCGAGAGLLLASVFVTAANGMLGSELAYTPARLDWRVLLAFAVIALLATLVIALAPALFALRVRPMETLRGEGRSTTNRASRRFRNALVGVQIAMAVMLLIGATNLIRSVRHLEAADLGFDTTAVAARVVWPDSRTTSFEQKTAFARTLVTRVKGVAGVKAAAIASDLPFGNDSMALGLELEPGAPKRNVGAGLRLVGPEYFKAMGIDILSGRVFSARDARPGVHTVVVNRAFAIRLLGAKAAVGHRLSYREHEPSTTGPDGKPVEGAQIWYDIIGVVDDTLDATVTEPASPRVYVDAEIPKAMTLMESGFAIVARGGADPNALVAAMATITRALDRQATVYDVEQLSAKVQRSYRQRTVLKQVLTVFGLVSIIVTIIGLFGVTSYAVVQRTREIGIRRALGASRGAIMRLILTETAIVVSVGICVGLVCAYSMRTLLASLLYGVEATDPTSYAVVCLGLGIVALLSALAPARAAARVLPSSALKTQ